MFRGGEFIDHEIGRFEYAPQGLTQSFIVVNDPDHADSVGCSAHCDPSDLPLRKAPDTIDANNEPSRKPSCFGRRSVLTLGEKP